MTDSTADRARDTSRAAAAGITDGAPMLRAKALRMVRSSSGMTADEVAAALGVSILSIRPRMTELAHRGQIRDSGSRRRNVSGKSAIVWIAVI